MQKRDISLVCGDYDRTRRILDGTMQIDGYALRTSSLPPEEMFKRAFGPAEFDVSELSACLFMQCLANGTCAYVGIPAFPSRSFRHAAIFVRSDSSIKSAADLAGKTIGLRSFLNTAALVVRGLLKDEFQVDPCGIKWRLGDLDEPERRNIPVPGLAQPFDIQVLDYGTTLSQALLSGAIDAIVHYDPPRAFFEKDPKVRRIFSDVGAAERAYFQKTGIFPIMHLVGIRRSLVEQDPTLPWKVYDAFARAKARAISDLGVQGAQTVSLPWLRDDVERTVALAGTDFWPYGIDANKAALESLVRYAFEQGLTSQRLNVAALFDPTLSAT
ncbi:ABC transporter substrate-binding protein [Bradyrhizobium sp.]|uniref:ABC transporter substrate-binding protein n=1 Tax=Bradyrhizobium sp. TaxID=376 RepID=UPI0039E36C01